MKHLKYFQSQKENSDFDLGAPKCHKLHPRSQLGLRPGQPQKTVSKSSWSQSHWWGGHATGLLTDLLRWADQWFDGQVQLAEIHPSGQITILRGHFTILWGPSRICWWSSPTRRYRTWRGNFKMGHLRPLFLYFAFSIQLVCNNAIYDNCWWLRIKLRICGVGSDCSTNCATTTAHCIM